MSYYRIPEWVQDLDAPDPEAILSIYEESFPHVIEQFEQSASQLYFWRRWSRRALIETLGREHVHANIDEESEDRWGTKTLGVHFVGLKTDIYPPFHESVPHHTSLAIINTLMKEQRDALAKFLTIHFCKYYADVVPSRHSLRDSIGQKASRISQTFDTLLPAMFEMIKSGAGKTESVGVTL